MEKELVFSKIQNEDIFVEEYKNFVKNNKITFSKKGIAVLYGPNGTGKTSLVKVLSGEKGTTVNYNYNNVDYEDNSQFYVINDQNNRNIIKGTAKDFLLGDNVRKELDLQEYIKNEYERLCGANISILKEVYGISSSSSKAVECFEDYVELQIIIKDFVNNKSKGSKINIGTYIDEMEKYKGISVSTYDKAKLNYIIKEISSKSLFMDDIQGLDVGKISNNTHIKEVEENAEAIRILTRFNYKKDCIVCDATGIQADALLEKKTKNKDSIIKSLDDKTKKIIEGLISQITEEDPFDIKKIMLEAIETGKTSEIANLQTELKQYKEVYASKAIRELVDIYLKSDIKEKYLDYQNMVSKKPEITEEDFLYIEQIINNSMSKKLQIIRDNNKNIKIVLENRDFLEVDRDKLPLSTGEQNFLSLTFEFLKAKNSDKPIVVLDDPISSFDTIYKNKIVYAIVKILENKKKLIMTHNVDLLRLLDGQFPKCFNLFLFNNTENEENGFIGLKSKEQDILINIDKLLHTFRKEIYSCIKESELYLVSMIPFMRGYATMTDNTTAKESLTQLMHGYKTEKIDIAKVYRELFGNHECELMNDTNHIIPNHYEISVNEILTMITEGKEIVDKNQYPLLNRTLLHSFSYLFLRLIIEKKLVEKYKIDTTIHNKLGQIISEAFPSSSNRDEVRKRVMLTTKKTLLNEFNHFEGNMSIFQPAIDITDHILEKEKEEIINFVNTL